ncbi:hypothetical protein, partial [Nocardia puris]|uniref:hypothetical protein n=1 Tax=Nocardia puris TaxID=208602 RepID=UPI001E6597F9
PEPARQRRLMIGPTDIQIILGKVRPLSRPHPEAHPQVLIIALVMSRSASVIQVQGGLDVAAVRLPADGERDRGVTVVVIAAVVEGVSDGLCKSSAHQ